MSKPKNVTKAELLAEREKYKDAFEAFERRTAELHEARQDMLAGWGRANALEEANKKLQAENRNLRIENRICQCFVFLSVAGGVFLFFGGLL